MNPKYLSVRSIEEALEHLHRHGEETRILAGGTDVMVVFRTARTEGSRRPEYLLDITNISDLKKIDFIKNEMHIGAAVTFRELEIHRHLQKKCPLLAMAASRIGSRQVRHLATLGGNVGTASPAGDGITPLIALSAEALIGSVRGRRTLPVAELITGPGETVLDPDELIIAFSFKSPNQPTSCFFDKVMRRQAVAIARMNVAIQLSFDFSNRITSARIAAGAVLPRPQRLREVEEMLADQLPGEDLFTAAGETATQVMLAMSGTRPSRVYKVPALKHLVTWGLKQASEAKTKYDQKD